MSSGELQQTVDFLLAIDVGNIIGILTRLDQSNQSGTGTLSASAKKEISENLDSFISFASAFYRLVSRRDVVFEYMGAKTVVQEGKSVVHFDHPDNLDKIDIASFRLKQVRDQFREFLRDRLALFSSKNPGVSNHGEQRFLSALLEKLNDTALHDTKVLSDIKVWRNLCRMGEAAFD